MTRVRMDQLSKVVSSQLKESEDSSSALLSAFVGAIKSALKAGRDVQLTNFGSFSLATKDGRPMPSVSRANITNEMAAKMAEPDPAGIENRMSGLLEILKNEILSGHEVELDDIGAFEVKIEKPRIEKQAKGHRLIKPAFTALRFVASKPIATPGGEGQAVFEPADAFTKRIEQFRSSTIMLVVPERDFFTKTLEYYFENAGWELETITSLGDAIKRIESGKAYLAIVDAVIPEHQKFCQLLKSRRESALVPLILLWPSEQAWKILKEVSIVGDENLCQPFEFRQLLDYADSEIIRSAEEELIFDQQIHIHMPTDEQSIEKVIDQVHRLVEASGMTDEGQVAFSAAFREGVVNAAQHGNKYKKEKKIEVQYLVDREKITAVVKDQGQGFDHEKYVMRGVSKDAITAARERHAQGRMGGLGILLMLRCCDRLEYNSAGNQVTLTKYLKGAPAE